MSVVASLTEALRSEVAVRDAGAWAGTPSSPEAVVHPASTEEVAATLRWAAAHRVGVAVVASGRRFALPKKVAGPFLMMCTERLAGIEIYEAADLTLTAKAGTRLTDVSSELAKHGQWLPFDPPHVESRTLGGLVAMGKSGPLWMGYGALRNHVLGMTLVCGDGRTLKLGGRVVKNVAGFDLLKPAVGSRGRLGVITSVCVRAFPRPAVDRALVLRGDSAQALAAVALAVGTAPVMPVSSVLLSGAAAGARGARLIVRLHGAEPTVEADQVTLERHCGVRFERASADEVARARDHAAEGEVVLGLSVLPSHLGETLGAVRELLGDVGVMADTYQASVRVSTVATDARAIGRLRARVESFGGTLSVEDAADDVDVAGFASDVPPPAASLAKSLESVFDPQGVLWPCRP